MRRAFVTVAAAVACIATASAALPPIPVAKRVPVKDTYYGTSIVDPYRWMEATPRSPEFLAYLKANNDRTRSIFDGMPGRAKLTARLTELADTAVGSNDVTTYRDTYFYEKTPKGANSAKLFIRTGATGFERTLVDPDAMSGPRQAIPFFVPSDDGKRIAVGLAAGGSENANVHVVDAASGTMLGDVVDRADFGVTSWTDDGSAFYYLKRQVTKPGDPPTAKYLNVTAYRHVVGQPGSSDVPIFGRGLDPAVDVPAASFPGHQFEPGVAVRRRSRHQRRRSVRNGVRRSEIVARFARYDSVETDYRALRQGDDRGLARRHDLRRHRQRRAAFQGRQVRRGVRTFAAATDVVPAGPRVVDSVASASDAFITCNRARTASGRLTRVSYTGGEAKDIPLPVNGTVTGLSTEYDRPGFVARLESWTTSPLWYRYDSKRDALVDTKLDAPSTANYTDIVADEVKVPAADGTLVPLSIVHRRALTRDGSNPTLLYAYGSYGISTDPNFSPSRLAFLERGGVYAFAHVRGGGEYGEEWHLAGKGTNKPRTISDFIDCARWLVAQRYTSSAKLGARGGSAGGITMGGAIDDAPSLFAAVLDEIPVSDQLRIETTPNGPPNIPEFGSTATASGFKILYATSALHHVKPHTAYPAVMLTTGINDPRVDPWQAAKMAATLAAATSSGKPILLRVDYDGGHGLIGGSKTQGVALGADEISFLLWQFGDPDFQPKT